MKFIQLLRTYYRYICSMLAPKIPFNWLRHILYRGAGLRIPKSSFIWPHNYFSAPEKVIIGEHSIIGPRCYFLSQGDVHIGKNVNISGFSYFITQSHVLSNGDFDAVYKKIVIEDDCWVAVNVTIMPGVHMERGSVVAASSVLTKRVNAFDVVGGNPAKLIGKRQSKINYKLNGKRSFYTLWTH